MSGSYTPQPGSVADRAIAHLSSLAPGAELSGPALAEAIGAPPFSLPPCLAPAAEQGAVLRRQKGGHPRSPIFWSVPPEAADSARRARSIFEWRSKVPMNGHAVTEPVPQAAEAPATAEVQILPEPIVPVFLVPPPAVEAEPEAPRPPKAPAPAQQPLPLRIALWSDGSLEVRRGGTLALLLTADETSDLVRYIDRLAQQEGPTV